MTKNVNTQSQQLQATTKQKILNALQKGPLTVAQARQRFKVANVSARISELRKAGHNIVCTPKMTKKGELKYYYTLVS